MKRMHLVLVSAAILGLAASVSAQEADGKGEAVMDQSSDQEKTMLMSQDKLGDQVGDQDRTTSRDQDKTRAYAMKKAAEQVRDQDRDKDGLVTRSAVTTFVDRDGDGVCDNSQARNKNAVKSGAKKGKALAKGTGKGVADGTGSMTQGRGAGFVDANADGVCDNFQSGNGGSGSGSGSGKGYGKGK